MGFHRAFEQLQRRAPLLFLHLNHTQLPEQERIGGGLQFDRQKRVTNRLAFAIQPHGKRDDLPGDFGRSGIQPQGTLIGAQRGREFIRKLHRTARGEESQRLFFIALVIADGRLGSQRRGCIFQREQPRRHRGLVGLHANRRAHSDP